MQKADLLDQFYENMATMKRAMHGKMDLQSDELSHSQVALLFTLSSCQPISPKNLASRMYLTAGAVSQVVDSLAEHGLVERVTDPNDRRSQILKLTRSGQAKLHQAEKHRRKYLGSILEDLSVEELALLLKVQEKITHRFSAQKPANHSNEN